MNTDNVIKIYTVFDNKQTLDISFTEETTAEDVCFAQCKSLGIGPVARHLFALRKHGKHNFLKPSANFTKKSEYDLRLRYKPASLNWIKKIDPKAYDYYFHQVRTDVLDNKIPDLVYEKYKRELVGLGVVDMYRVMKEKDIPRDTVLNDYKKFVPKEVMKRHAFFVKKPMHDSLVNIEKTGRNACYVKAEYLKQLDSMVPEYLSEEYKAYIDKDGSIMTIVIRVPPSSTDSEIKFYYESKKEKWIPICLFEDLVSISIRIDGTVEISRKNGVPFYVKFATVDSMWSFVSLLDGYYRLSVKWIFNLCKDAPTPSIAKLNAMKCHGPVGGEFAYAKLETRRGNYAGSFILRESENKYNVYFVDVCTKESSKPKTFKIEKISSNEYIFDNFMQTYPSIQQLIASFKDPADNICLTECLPPSEYDQSPLLLCRSSTFSGDSLTDSSTLESASMPLIIHNKDLQVYKGFKKNEFHFYSALGTDVLWSFPFCDDDGDCDVHTTTSHQYQNYWPVRETDIGRDVHFFVRAYHSAFINLVATPTIRYPTLKIQLQRADEFTRIILLEYEGGPSAVLKELKSSKLITYWKWNEFSISFFADTLQIHITKDGGTHLLTEITHRAIKKLRWFSVASENSIAHWTFFCTPASNPKDAWLPECALSTDEPDYNGTQSVTDKGLPCIPWAAKKVLPKDVSDMFPAKEIFKNWNHCRDPKKEKKGTFCYVFNSENKDKVEKQYCHIRKCKSSECKVAGTGNDYIGKVSVTRSNRSCQYWVDDSPKYETTLENKFYDMYHVSTMRTTTIKIDYENKTQMHKVPSEYLNGSLYADTSATLAKNYCRNPSRSIAGNWCYTTDPDVPKDICNIRDCEKQEECIVVTKGKEEGRDIYILPQWKEIGHHGGLHFSLKQWNPDYIDGVMFEFRSFEKEPKIKLLIGGDKNQKVILFYKSEKVKEKTLPHLIASGRWTSFWLQIRKGEMLLGLQGVPTSLFEWQYSGENASAFFEPRFLSYRSIDGYPIGAFFKCDECHTERIISNQFSKIMPISIWKKESTTNNILSLKVRGDGTLLVAFMAFPESPEYYLLVFSSYGRMVTLLRTSGKSSTKLTDKNFDNQLVYTNQWTDFNITLEENSILVTLNGSLVLHYESNDPMIIYWFSIGADKGWITWTANCIPLDIDAPPLDGGWSSWSKWECTVSCGGGEGYRTRTCSNPRPNIFGKLCEGPATSTGKCNDFLCGDISPQTLEKIRQNLQTRNFKLIVDENESVVLTNDHEVLDIIAVESPDAFYEWTLNGVIIDSDPEHIEFKNDDIYINSAEASDSGLYVCMVYRITKQRVVIKIISLAVRSRNWDISIRATLSVTLYCNSVILGYIYSDLSQKWVVNETTLIDYGITTFAAVNTETLHNLNMSNTGVWQCVIEQHDLGLSWVTNIIKLEVKSKPTFFTHLMEDHLTAPLFSWLKTEIGVIIFLLFIVIFVIALVAFGLYAYLKWCTLDTRIKRNRKP